MLETRTNPRLADLWDDAKASAMSEPELLLYRSNLLGSDKRITNYGGGNTSAKVMEKDPLTGETGRGAVGARARAAMSAPSSSTASRRSTSRSSKA